MENWVGCDLCGKWRLVPADCHALSDKALKLASDEDWHCELGVGVVARGFKEYVTKANWLCTDEEESQLRVYEIDEEWQRQERVRQGLPEDAPVEEEESVEDATLSAAQNLASVHTSIPSAPVPTSSQPWSTGVATNQVAPTNQTEVDNDPLGLDNIDTAPLLNLAKRSVEVQSNSSASEKVQSPTKKIKSHASSSLPSPSAPPPSKFGRSNSIGGRSTSPKNLSTLIPSLPLKESLMSPAIVKRFTSAEFGKGEGVEREGFEVPIVASGGLEGLTVQCQSFGEVVEVLGKGFKVKVIKCDDQTESSMTIDNFNTQLLLKSGTPTAFNPSALNLISLEFSNTALMNRVKAPTFVTENDWITTTWPRERMNNPKYHPQVRHYCLASQPNSYTDFHADFGGSSVWYHVVSGLKTFYLIPPTLENLAIYEDWLCDPLKTSTFLGDLISSSKLTLNAGETLFIPSGWIHAVHTPVDSLVFGGNFMHGWGTEMQIRINNIEERAKVQTEFRFPFFQQLQFYSASLLLRRLRSTSGYDSLGRPLKAVGEEERQGGKNLVEYCRAWSVPNADKQGFGSVGEVSLDATRLANCKSIASMLDELDARLKGEPWTEEGGWEGGRGKPVPQGNTTGGNIPIPPVEGVPTPTFGAPAPPPAFGAPPPAFGYSAPEVQKVGGLSGIRLKHTAGAELDKDDEDFEPDFGEEEDEEESYEAFQKMKEMKRKGEDEEGEFVDDLHDWADEEEVVDEALDDDGAKKSKKQKTKREKPGHKLGISISRKDINKAVSAPPAKNKQDVGRNALFKKLGGWGN